MYKIPSFAADLRSHSSSSESTVALDLDTRGFRFDTGFSSVAFDAGLPSFAFEAGLAFLLGG